MRDLISKYKERKPEIKKRLKEFKSVWEQSEKRIFGELCFCICTPQSKAVYCDKAVSGLERTGVLFKGDLRRIRAGLNGVRFPNNKAKFILEARERLTEGKSIRIKDRINAGNIPETRRWIVQSIRGIGYKEASHFLRNIGFGRDLAILDVHILRCMVKLGVIEEVPKNITEAGYLFLEKKLRKFAKKINIPMNDLDLLLWSNETGNIFK